VPALRVAVAGSVVTDLLIEDFFCALGTHA
jgi:hypothetical protein